MILGQENLGIGPDSKYGTANVSLDSELVLTANVAVKVDIVAELQALAAKTATPLDDKIVSYLKEFLTAANAVLPAVAPAT